jgi:hypothetical protein
MLDLSQLQIVLGIIVSLILIGGFLRSKYNPLKRTATDTIENIKETELEGSIDQDGKRWDYTVKRYGDSIEGIDIDEPPACADCDAPLERTRDNPIGLNKRVTVWECSDCGRYYDYKDDEPSIIEEQIRRDE